MSDADWEKLENDWMGDDDDYLEEQIENEKYKSTQPEMCFITVKAATKTETQDLVDKYVNVSYVVL